MRRFFSENKFRISSIFILSNKFLSKYRIDRVKNQVCFIVILNQVFTLIMALKNRSQVAELVGIVTAKQFFRK